MENTSFGELQIQLDTPYLYLHLGNCEHLFVVRNIRLVHDQDEQNPAEYPIRIRTAHPAHQRCLVYLSYYASYFCVQRTQYDRFASSMEPNLSHIMTKWVLKSPCITAKAAILWPITTPRAISCTMTLKFFRITPTISCTVL
jgi:hypothetical protein